MAISKNITWTTLSITGAVLRIRSVHFYNDPDMKKVVIDFAVYASADSYGDGDQPLFAGSLTLDSVNTATAFTAYKTKMEEEDENALSAAYVAVKQLSRWTSATATNLGDE